MIRSIFSYQRQIMYYKYTDKDADVAMPLTDLGIDPDKESCRSV